MSVVDDLKGFAELAKDLAIELPRITLVSNSGLTVENYKLIKAFDSNQVLLTFERYNMLITGTNLIIESFTPARINICGSISRIEYLSCPPSEARL